MQKEKGKCGKKKEEMELVYYLLLKLKLQIIIIACLLPFLSTRIGIAEAN